MNLTSIVQQLQAAQQHQATARPAAAISSTSDASSASGASSNASPNPATSEATITADDFLQLLVSELQNQDPTADTDPNEYVNQLVDVNSLQQLISINQEVGDLAPSSTAPGTSSVTGAPATSAAQEPGASPASPNAQASYTALDPLASANVPGLFNGLSSTSLNSAVPAGNSAIPASWRPKTIAVP